MIETVLTVPDRDNTGAPFDRKLWDELEHRLVALGGGFTLSADYQGVWSDAGTVYRDVNRRYEVTLASWMDLPTYLEIVRWVREEFDQLAIYFKINGIPEVWPR